MTASILLQQAVLVRQLQDQHYHQYMQQLVQQRSSSKAELSEVGEKGEEEAEEHKVLANGSLHHSQPDSEEDDDDDEGRCTSITLSLGLPRVVGNLRRI